MKKKYIIPLACFFIAALTNLAATAQTVPAQPRTLGPANQWAENQLIEPSALAAELKDLTPNSPLIFNIGAVGDIKDARHIGPVGKAENLEKFKSAVAALARNTPVIIYCGCCPFAKCPNIRPAFTELQKQGFTNIKVLNLPVNLQTNWIAKGYPMAKE